MPNALSQSWRTARPVERGCYVVGALLMLAGVFHLGVFFVRGGPWAGPVSWRKPTTFGLSFGLTLLTITWVTSYLRLPGRLRTVLLMVFAGDCVLAVGGAVLVVTLTVFAVAALRGDPEQAPSMRLALRAGFVTLLIGLGSGIAMIARGVTLANTGHQQLAYQLGGFLKPVHAVSLHGVLVLPAVAWLLARSSWPEERRVGGVALAAAAYAMAIAAALVLSLLG
jgi:hypothetical protein